MVAGPRIPDHLKGFEAVLCLVGGLALLEGVEELLGDWNGVGCVERDKGDRDARMDHLWNKVQKFLNL